MLNRRPGGSAFCWLLAFSTTCCLRLLWSPTIWLHRGSPGPLRPGVAFPTTLVSDVSDPSLSDFLSWQSYIIVQRPLSHPLNLRNGMFDRHQAEITVMQFRGHSLPVHQSMSVPWFFLPCPISSAKPVYAIFFRLLAIGMCHFLRVHHFGMACLAGPKVKIQHLCHVLPVRRGW